MGDLIQLDNVSVVYSVKGHSPRHVLNGFDLAIQEREFLTVCGQTGCGKSTMLRLILGAEQPIKGRVLIDGEERPRPDRTRGYVPQKYSLFPHKTVLDNITFGPEMEEFGLLRRWTARFAKRRRELREVAHRYLQQMGLSPADANKYPEQLSGGMQQRVAIAQALIMHPKILLMDEAFSALDPGTRADMQGLVRKLWAETGITIVFVTHNTNEAIFLGNRIVLLGKESSEGSSQVVLDFEIPPECRTASGYPRPEEMERLTRLIEVNGPSDSHPSTAPEFQELVAPRLQESRASVG